MKKRYYNLMIICDGAMPNFMVDEDTLKCFEKSFDSGDRTIEFIDRDDKGEVKLRNQKLVGYKKTFMDFIPPELEDSQKDI